MKRTVNASSCLSLYFSRQSFPSPVLYLSTYHFTMAPFRLQAEKQPAPAKRPSDIPRGRGIRRPQMYFVPGPSCQDLRYPKNAGCQIPQATPHNEARRFGQCFDPSESMKNAGILDVFPIFHTARLGQKIRRSLQLPPKRCCPQKAEAHSIT